MAPVEWTPSADRHGIDHEDILWAISHATGSEELQPRIDRPGETVRVFVGRPYAGSRRFIEVIALIRPPRTIVVFHAMELSDLFRHLAVEGE